MGLFLINTKGEVTLPKGSRKGWEGNSAGHSEAKLNGMYLGAKKHSKSKRWKVYTPSKSVTHEEGYHQDPVTGMDVGYKEGWHTSWEYDTKELAEIVAKRLKRGGKPVRVVKGEQHNWAVQYLNM